MRLPIFLRRYTDRASFVSGTTRQQQHLLGGKAEVGLAVCREQSAIRTLQPTSPDSLHASRNLRMRIGT